MDKLCIPLLVGLFLFKFIVYSQCCPNDQMQALLQFKFSVNSLIPNLNSSSFESSMSGLNTWNSSSDCCNWDRVSCKSRSHSHSRVVVGLHLEILFPLLMIDPLAIDVVKVNPNVLTPLFRIKSLMLLNISYNLFHGQILGNGFANLTKLVHLDMRGNQFNGSIPPQLFHLRFLRYLDLSRNILSGNIPLGFTNLTNLFYLNMSSNNFDGSIPPEIFQLMNLRYLSLNSNSLKGVLRRELSYLGNLTKLQHLSLGFNGFSGEISSSILELKELQILELGNNLLSGQLPCVANLSKISTLDFSKNDFSGTIPPSIQNLSNLETLHLHNNKLSGEIPSWLFDSKALKSLFLGGKGDSLAWKNNTKISSKCMLSELKLESCGLVGEIPEWISTLKRLKYLDLSGNRLEGTFPPWLAEMEIDKIVLSRNKLTGSIPPRLFQSQCLSSLLLSDNNFSGELPENISDAIHIATLLLQGNNFSGPIPNSISKLHFLEILDLSRNRFFGNTFPVFEPDALTYHIDFSYNEFSGEIPVTFPRGILFIALANNRFSGSIPQNFTNFHSLVYLSLSDNKITGEFPKFLLQIPTLQVLSLRNNYLHGSIGTSNNFSKLRFLDLSSNRLTGSIPIEFGSLFAMMETYNDTGLSSCPFGILRELSALIVTWKKSTQSLLLDRVDFYTLLDLSNNQLSGKIPASLGHLKGLKQLNFSYNRLSGSIPSSFGGLKNVESLDLSHNKLSGSIPQSLIMLQQLNTFDVSNNKLKGKIPVGGQMDSMNDPNYFANNSGLCGRQIQVPCSDEPPPPKTQGDAVENTKDPWFLWEGVLAGLPFGFFLSIGIVFLTRYIALVPQLNRHHLLRRWRFA